MLFSPIQISYINMALVVALFVSAIVSFVYSDRRTHLFVSSSIFILITVSSLLGISESPGTHFAFGIFNVSNFSMYFFALLALAMELVNVISYEYSPNYLQFSMLFSFAATGAFIVALSASFIPLIIGLELMVLPTVFMILSGGKAYVEPSVKMFVLAALSIVSLTFATAMAFQFDPSLSLHVPALQVPSQLGALGLVPMLVLLLFIAGLSMDASLFPFNLWVPDVYSGSPANITALLAGVNKKVAFVAMIEVLFVAFLPLSGTFSLALQLLAVFTMFFGNLLALVQTSVKRMFAYSSIAQAGYITIGLAAASEYGLTASMFYIAAHMFMIIGAFAVVLWLESNNIKSVNDYAGLSSRSMFGAVSLSVLMISMIGIPPMTGFVGKVLLFSSALGSGMLLLAAIGVLNSLISVYYYARVIIPSFARKAHTPLGMPAAILAVVGFCVLFTVAFGLYPQPLVSLASLSSNSIYAI